jgi:hypothetical protein
MSALSADIGDSSSFFVCATFLGTFGSRCCTFECSSGLLLLVLICGGHELILGQGQALEVFPHVLGIVEQKIFLGLLLALFPLFWH